MQEYDFTEEYIRNIISKVKQQDYVSGKYLEDNILISKEGIIFRGDADILKSILNKIKIEE